MADEDVPGQIGTMLDEMVACAGMPRAPHDKGSKVLSKREALAVLTLVRAMRQIMEGMDGNREGNAGAV